ncbi:MAG: hypothetical protein QW331_04645 [Candidatus Woesearchaeota archaeon]
MGKGRPIGSEIRNNIIEILAVKGKMYGYDLYKNYIQIFPKVTMRSIYYHLQKGIKLGEIKVAEVKKEKGNFSWGSEVEKTYYFLGDKAKPKGDKRVRDFVEQKKE